MKDCFSSVLLSEKKRLREREREKEREGEGDRERKRLREKLSTFEEEGKKLFAACHFKLHSHNLMQFFTHVCPNVISSH